MCLLKIEEALSGALRCLGIGRQLPKMRLDQSTEVGKVRQLPFPPQQQTAELFLELLDRTGQCRLRDVALLGSAREVQRVGNGQKIADLVHLHAATVPAVRCARKTSVCGTWPQSRRMEFLVRQQFS